jgi:hypothetical protein
MDWKYKHFTQEAVFHAEPEIVRQAVIAFATDWLADWKVSETSEGIEARGYSGLHLATARFRVERAAEGTKLIVEMQVQRASGRGFMLVDIGGFYNGKIRQWLGALPWWIHQKEAEATRSEGQTVVELPGKPQIPKMSPALHQLLGCSVIGILLVFALWFCWNLIAAIIGLVTGNLDLPGRGGDLVLHGLWARIVSALILLLFGWIAFRIWKPKKRNRGSGWLPPPSR